MKWLSCVFLVLFFVACTDKQPSKPSTKQNVSPVKKTVFDSTDSITIAETREYIARFLKGRGFNGMIAFSVKNEIVFDTLVGYKSLKKRNKLDSTTVFQLASVSKPITAMLTLMLIDSGLLKLEDTLGQYIWELNPNYAGIRIKELLSHRSGLSNYNYYCDSVIEDKECNFTNDSLIEVMNCFVPNNYFQANKRHNYCNTNYALLANVIERVTKMSYHEALKKYIMKPSGMENSFVLQKGKPLPSNLALGNQWNKKSYELNFLDGVVGDKGIYSNAKEILLFDAALNSGKLISDSLLELSFKPHNRIKLNQTSYGLGWRLKFHPKLGKVIYHTGWWHGNRHIYIKIPAKNLTLVFLSNSIKGSIYSLNEILDAVS